MESDSIGAGTGTEKEAVIVQFSIVPYAVRKGVKFSLPESALSKALQILNERRQDLAQLLLFAGQLTEIEMVQEESDNNSDSDDGDDDNEEEDLNQLSKINISVACRHTAGLKQLNEFLKPDQGLAKWITENIVASVKGFKSFTVLLEENYFIAVLKRVRSVEKQLKDTEPTSPPSEAASDGADSSTKSKASDTLPGCDAHPSSSDAAAAPDSTNAPVALDSDNTKASDSAPPADPDSAKAADAAASESAVKLTAPPADPDSAKAADAAASDSAVKLTAPPADPDSAKAADAVASDSAINATTKPDSKNEESDEVADPASGIVKDGSVNSTAESSASNEALEDRADQTGDRKTAAQETRDGDNSANSAASRTASSEPQTRSKTAAKQKSKDGEKPEQSDSAATKTPSSVEAKSDEIKKSVKTIASPDVAAALVDQSNGEKKLDSWLTSKDYLQLSEAEKARYTVFDFRLFIADVFKLVMDEISSQRRGVSDSQHFMQTLSTSLLTATCDINVSLVINNKSNGSSYSLKKKVFSLKDFYALPSWRVFFLTDKIDGFVYNYSLAVSAKSPAFQLGNMRQLQDALKKLGSAYSSPIERALNNSTRIANAIIKCCSKKVAAPPDGIISEMQTRPLSKDRLVCFDALLEPYIDSVVGKSNFFWRIFAAHALSLVMAASSTIFVSNDPVEFLDQCYSSLMGKWLRTVTEKDAKKQLEVNATEFTSVLKRMLSPPFTEHFPLRPGAGILLCRISLFIQHRFATENKSFWKSDDASMLLSFLQKPSLKGISSQAIRFLDSSLSPFLVLCYCAKVLHPSAASDEFGKLIRNLGFVERGGDKFRSDFAEALLKSGLMRSISCSNFVGVASAVFNEAEDLTHFKLLLEEFLTIKEADEVLSAFESSDIPSSSLKLLVQSFGSSLLYKKHLADLQKDTWQRFCDVYSKVKKLQDVEESVWQDEVVPVVRAAIIASIKSKFENDNAMPNRTALTELLDMKGVFDENLSIEFLSIIFSSKTHWLIKFCLEKFSTPESTFLNQVLHASPENQKVIICQFARMSCDYLHKSVCAAIAPLLEHSSSRSFECVCKEAAFVVLNEKTLRRSVIESNVEDGKTSGLTEVVFQVCLQRVRDSNSEQLQREEILKFFQHPNDSFCTQDAPRSLFELLGLSLNHFLSSSLRQRNPTAFELLNLLLEKHFMWLWMSNDSDPSIQPLADTARQQICPKLQCIFDFAKKLFGIQTDAALSLSELQEFVATFDRLEKTRKLSRESFQASLFDYFDLLLKAFFEKFNHHRQTKEVVESLEENQRKWNEQSAVVEQIFDFLFLISGESSQLNLKLLDLDAKQSRYQSLKQKFTNSISSVGSDDLVFQIFEIRNVQNLELMKSLVKSELFRIVFVRSNPASGGTCNLFETEHLQSAAPKRLGAPLISVQCNYVLDKMLPDACTAYKEFWVAVEKGSLLIEHVEAFISADSKMDLKLEQDIVSSLKISGSVVDKLHRVRLRNLWRSRVEYLKFFLTDFFTENDESVDCLGESSDSANELSDDENTSNVASFCHEAFINHDDATSIIDEFLSQDESTTSLIDYLDVFNDIVGAFGTIDNNVWEVFSIMHECRKETLPFLREQQSSDFQQLLDNTDDTIAQDLSLSVINSLISLQQALRNFLSSSPKTSVKDLEHSVLQSLKYFEATDSEANIQNDVNQRQKAAKNLIDRIKECNGHINSIKALHASMGSRGETSKILAISIVNEKEKIQFLIQTHQSSYSCRIFRKSESSETEYSLSQLRDHRSRIIITLSSQKTNSTTGRDESIILRNFVQLVDCLEGTFETAENLLQKGHPLFAEKKLCGCLSNCNDQLGKLQKIEVSWDEMLRSLRLTFSSANYVFGLNLLTLFQVFYLGRDKRDLRNILYFMKIDFDSFDAAPLQEMNSDALNPSDLPRLFRKMFAVLDQLPRMQPRVFKSLQIQKTDMCIKQGELLVCQMNPTEKDVISIFLNVWISSQKEVPWISEVVFCSQDTVSDEVVLAINRSAREKDRTTFLVEVQNLRQKVLREVIAELIRQHSQHELGRVAILCRAAESHSIFTVFRDNVIKGKALTEEKLKIVLKECFSNVFFCTSDRPSVGKSEQIVTASQSQDFRRIHISGFVQKLTVMEKIKKARIMNNTFVHIDIGSVQNADLLELILFEAIFCGTMSTAHAIVQFRPKTLYLEIANSIDKELEDSFTLFSSLSDAKCEWKHLKNLEVSNEPTSPIQIVCKYLYLLATDAVDVTEVNLTDCVPSNVCLNLLGQFFNHPLEDGKRPSEIMSFLVLESCLKILGEQLKKFTASAYFKVKNLQLVYGGRVEIRAKMVGLIMQSTLKLTLKSVSSIKYQQSESRKNIFDHTVKRFRGLINWEDSSYVLPVFMNQDISTVELIFRRLSDVTSEIRELFSGASSKELKEFSSLSQADLFEKLVKIAAKNQIGYTPNLRKELTENYTLTADNFLKMILITLRIDADVPVIIIGETGCGKTSLIRYLAAVQECTLVVMNFHAGISEDDIIQRVSEAEQIAKSQLKEFVESSERSGIVWMFLDEVNTCDHLGMLKEIVCHRRFLDRELPCNLRFIAACNPYVLRPKCDDSKRAGLEIKELRDDKMMNLVYRVHPLPETMVELVWDFGRLTDSDEHAYIAQMVALSIPQKMLRKEITECLSAIQKFIRKLEDSEYATSLRDVRRFCEFYKFFIDYFKKKAALNDSKLTENPSKKAFLFSLYICYYVRIADLKDRHTFAEKICSFFDKTAEQIQNDFMAEELDVLKRMRVPRKTARNLALRENVFILFCCIYCQVPVLLVGKPGCSKSLAVNLIRSNLRGKDSEDPLFRQFPSLRFFSYQGSEASTSEGIRRIFSKAENSIEACVSEDSKPLVLIDEIGLAEKSRYNPLKVLHSLLEPDSSLDCKSRVSVVGISNWALDPAKMNRAIHISRPDMNEEELCETGKAICAPEGIKSVKQIPDEVLNRVATACHRYFKEQPFENFHGLRDFYYLLKFICDRNFDGDKKLSTIKEGLLRNFNGDKQSRKEVMKHFEAEFPGLKNSELTDRSSSNESETEALINRNLQDPQARHLMLIYESECCLDLLCFMLSQSNRTFKVMYGSQYEKDQYSEEFTYRKLNEVMMCMETGMVLILKDFDLIYGSLYDMLNQNYSEYAGRKYCRIAMGVQANQNCVVDKDFRCVVLVSKKEVRRLDPPFLNRFEKQVFDFEDKICSMKLERARNGLSTLMDNLSRVTFDDVVKTFKRTDVFQGYTPDLVASYLISIGRCDLEDHQASREVLPQLYRHMFPDAVLRTTYSKFENSRQYQQEYFDPEKLMSDLSSVLCDVMRSVNPIQKVFVYTKFSLYLDISKPLQGLGSHLVKEIRLMDFSREIDLLDSIVPFFKDNTTDGVLLIRIKPSIDERYILHVRCLIDGLCQRYSQEMSVKKAIVLIIHQQHEDLEVHSYSWNWSPLIEWKSYFIESLNPEASLCLSELVSSDYANSVFENAELMESLHKSIITSALTEALRSSELLNQAIQFFTHHVELEKQISSFIVADIMTKSSKNLQPFSPEHWLVKFALETTQLANFPSFSAFVLHGIKATYKENLIRILKAMGDFGIFMDNSSDSQSIQKALPVIWRYVLEKASDRFSRVRGLKNLSLPFSTFLFGITYDAFCRYQDDRNVFVTEIETLLKQFLDETELLSAESSLGNDFWRLVSTAFCGRDRSDSLRIVLHKQINQSSQLMEAVFNVLTHFKKHEKDVVDLLNVHHHMNKLVPDFADNVVRENFVDGTEFPATLNNLLNLLLPTEDNLRNLNMKELNDWRRVTVSFLGMLRARSEGLDCVAELEGMLKFCDFFLENNGDVEMSNVFNNLKERGLLTVQDNSSQLLQWRAFADSLSEDEGSKDRLISAEISFYYAVLSGAKLSDSLLEEVLKKIFDSILPVGFVAILWNKLKNESKELVPLLGELMEGCKSLEKRSSIYSIIATILTAEEQLDEDSLMETIDFVRSLLNKSLAISLSEMVDVSDILTYFEASVKSCAVTHNDFVCFGDHKDDMLAKVNKLIQTSVVHPLWLAFLRFLRRRFSLAEIETFLKFDRVTSVVSSLFREDFLRFGRGSEFIASYSLRYPFAVCLSSDVFQQALFAYQQGMLIKDWNEFSKIKQQLASFKNDEKAMRQFLTDCVSAYVEMVGLRKSLSNFKVQEKQVTREVLGLADMTQASSSCFSIVKILCGEVESKFNCFNLTAQCSKESLCLVTLYYAGLLACLPCEVKVGSLLHELSNMTLTNENQLFKIFASRERGDRQIAINVRTCSCYNVTIYSENDDPNFKYPCQFCHSDWTHDLSSKMVEFSEELLTDVVPQVSQFVCILMKAVLLDIERVKSTSAPASCDLRVEKKFRNLQSILSLSCEETTWLLHSILENKEELFFKVPQSDRNEVFENLAFFVGKHVLKAMQSIREFKRRRLCERQVVENFALACLVDNVDLSDDQLPNELVPPGRSKDDVRAIAANPLFFPKRLVTFADACALFDCHLAEGERRPLMHLILRFSDKLIRMGHASKLVQWHQTVLRKSDNVLSQEELEAMRIDDFLRRFRSSDVLESAASAWRALRPAADSGTESPLDKSRSLLSSLLTDRTETTKALREAVAGVNEFFEHVAVLCIEEKQLPELLSEDGSCVLPLCDVVTRPDSVPSCSAEELDEMVRVLASCPGGGDPSVHWELLEAALAKRLLAGKGFGCVEAWEGRLKGATERDLGTLVSAFRQMCQCERLSEAELAAFQRRQKEDSSRAGRTASLCRTLLGFCHRLGVSDGACTVAEFLRQHAGSLAGGAALAEAEAEGAGGLALSKLPALLEAAEQEQFSVIFADLQRRFGGHEETAERLAASVPEGDKPTLLALLKSACVRLLMADSTQCGLTMADLLADTSLLPVGAPGLRMCNDPALDKPAVELLFPLAHCLHKSEQNKTKGQRKFQKLLNRM